MYLFIIFSLFILLSSSKGNDDVGEGEGHVLTKNKHLLKPNSEKNDEEYVISKEKRKFNSELLKKLKFGRGNEDDDEDDGMFENDNFKEIQKALSRQTIRTESESGFSPVPEVSPSESMEAGYYNFLFYSSETDDMITEQANIIPIFYGCNSSVSDAFEDNTYNINKFINDLGSNSVWWWMVQQYSNPNVFPMQTTPSDSIGFVSQFRVTDTVIMCDYPFGTDLSDVSVQSKIVRNAIYRYNAGTGARNDVYIIIPDASVALRGACTDFCGMHYAYSERKRVFNIAVIANPFYCLNEFDDFHLCASNLLQANGDGSINNNVETDAQVNIIAHELADIMTNPYEGGYSSGPPSPVYGLDIADPCSWRFREVYYDLGGWFNEPMGSGRYLIQSIMPKFCPNVEDLVTCSSSIDWFDFPDGGCFCANFELVC